MKSSSKGYRYPKSKMRGNVFLFVPNIIGYVRIVALFIALYCMPTNPNVAFPVYMISQLLDAFDGFAARALNQGTSFGAVLDMVTDRVSTLGVFIVLAMFYPQYSFFWQILAILDIASHWLQMYSSLIAGQESHKDVKNFLLRIYYSNRVVLFLMCGGNELCLISIYLLYFSVGPIYSIFGIYKGLYEFMFIFTIPILLLKQFISIVQMILAAIKIANIDEEKREKANQLL